MTHPGTHPGLRITSGTTDAEIATARKLREQVFIVEQNVPAEIEWDGKDAEAHHLLAWLDGKPVGTLRWRNLGDAGKIERVCVLSQTRGVGAGVAMMDQVLADLRATAGIETAKLSAQVSVIAFYERLGFTAYGPIYDDAGIPHRDMTLPLAEKPSP
ncbi:MAG: GNAT family N-acetyltransferase [Pseudomonadota bacterium]